MFFKWIFKTACAVLIVTNTWNIVMGVFEAAQKAAEQYQQNVERLCQEKISAAESQAQEILARAKKAANQQ